MRKADTLYGQTRNTEQQQNIMLHVEVTGSIEQITQLLDALFRIFVFRGDKYALDRNFVVALAPSLLDRSRSFAFGRSSSDDFVLAADRHQGFKRESEPVQNPVSRTLEPQRHDGFYRYRWAPWLWESDATFRKNPASSLIAICFIKIISFFSFLFFSCGGTNSGSLDLVVVTTPTNLVINKVIVGSSATMPNGDGTGVVNFTASANNAKEYKMSVDGEILTSTTGNFTYTFKQSGTNEHTVYVSAYNGDKSISGSTKVTVYVIPKAVFFDEFNVDGAPDSSKWAMI